MKRAWELNDPPSRVPRIEVESAAGQLVVEVG